MTTESKPSFSQYLARSRIRLKGSRDEKWILHPNLTGFFTHYPRRLLFGHLDYDLLNLHTVNSTVNCQNFETLPADEGAVVFSLQLYNLTVGSLLKSETACHRQMNGILHLATPRAALKSSIHLPDVMELSRLSVYLRVKLIGIFQPFSGSLGLTSQKP